MRGERVDHLLGRLGVCARGDVRRWIADGRVVGRAGAVRHDDRVDPADITVDGAPLLAPGGLLLVLNKPAGVVCSASMGEGERVIDLVPDVFRRPSLQPVGRLDRDTTGVLVLTDRGDWNHAWTHPRRHVEKVYVATLDAPVGSEHVAAFAAGLVLGDGPCRPAHLEPDGSVARVTLSEGRHHQVKRMFAAVRREVLSLHRERFGAWTLDGLSAGACRQVTP